MPGAGGVSLFAVSDWVIALAYFLIPLVCAQIARRRPRMRSRGLFLFLSALLMACSLVHGVSALMPRPHPAWLDDAMKSSTAVLSLLALTMLVRLTPDLIVAPLHADLAEANRKMASILESTTVCVMAMDRAWTITYMNKNARAALNVVRDVHGLTLFDAFPEQLAAEREIFRKVMETRHPASIDGYYAPFDLWTQVQVHPWEDGGVAIFFLDVSQQKRVERELARERALRNQRVEALARLSAGFAHDLRNPLAIIHAQASDLIEMTRVDAMPPAEVIAQTGASIVQTSERAIRILSGVAALVKEDEAAPMRPAAVGAIVDEAMDLVQGRYKTHAVALNAEVPRDLPLVECREAQIEQVLVNLLDNAFDAVHAAPGDGRWVKLVAGVDGTSEDACERLRIDVMDGGPGVSAELKPLIMETFFSTKPRGAGTGVGLTVSRAIAQAHGGTLEMLDGSAHTCFRLSLPLHAAGIEEVRA